jgi:preprotein translocase subunit YajC
MPAFFASVLFAADPAQPQGPNMLFFLPIMIIMLYFMVLRPQKRAQKEHQARINALKSGDEVVACGGIHGLVTNVSDRLVTLKIADNVKIKVEKAAVMTILKKSDDPAPETPAPAEAESAKAAG